MSLPSHVLTLLLLSLSFVRHVYTACEVEITFPPPQLNYNTLHGAFSNIQSLLNESLTQGVFNTTSFSLTVSSSQKTLFESHHASDTPNIDGTTVVHGSSVYRIASNTKLFTSLAILQQQSKGTLGLDDPITKYIPNLLGNTTSKGISWKNITLRILMAHLSGIPDNYAEDDLLLSIPDPTVYGLPPIHPAQIAELPQCEGFSNYTSACTEPGQYFILKGDISFTNGTRAELLDDLQVANPVFPPKKTTSYSNVGYDLLGLVLANVTGQTYEDYILSSIIQPLGLNDTSFVKPDDSAGVVPADSYWNVDLGVGKPSGGLYSSSDDMITFLRYALNNYNSITPALNWFLPAAYSPGSHSFLGYPWEIFRTTSILPNNNNRPITFNTKGGGLTGYYSYSIVVPAYDLAVWMAVGGDSTALVALNQIFNSVLDPLVLAAESTAQDNLNQTYAGQYSSAEDSGLNSSIVLSQSDDRSLYISSWISNSTDVLSVFVPLVSQQAGTGSSLYFQLVPTFETRTPSPASNGSSGSGSVGEVWRFINVLESDGAENATTTWQDYCVANFDPLSYGGVPLNEIVFWRNGTSGVVESVGLSAFGATLRKE